MDKMYLDLPGVGWHSQEQRAGRIRMLQYGGRIRDGLLFCRILTNLNRFPFVYPMTILKPIRIHSSPINEM